MASATARTLGRSAMRSSSERVRAMVASKLSPTISFIA
jgi:hypothetical protein